jgi:5-methylcytosine-specific restriction endonuclease McrA
MRIEIIIFLITVFLIGNVYTDGKFLKKALSFKKYYQMAGIGFGGLVMWWLVKKNPQKANEMFATSNEYLKYLPIDQNSSRFISPVLDFTGGALTGTAVGAVDDNNMLATNNPIINMFSNSSEDKRQRVQENRMAQSGKKSTKRSVSETKKKYVAARQDWRCGDCNNQLTAWFEVDHKIRLEYGGSNHIDNLVALCRECHGKKTTIENL